MSSADDEPIGPLQDHVVRPARVAVTVKGATVLVLFCLFVALGIALAPQMATGLGLAQQVRATVTAVHEEPGTVDARTGRRGCDRSRITYSWGGGHSGSAEPCRTATGGDPAVGSVAAIWAVPGWDRVVVGSRVPYSVLVGIELAVLIVTGWAVAAYWRQLRALRAVGSREVSGPVLTGQRDSVVKHRRGYGVVRIRFDGSGHGWNKMVILGSVQGYLVADWEVIDVHALRRTRRGRPKGPYVLLSRDPGAHLPVIGTARPLPRAR